MENNLVEGLQNLRVLAAYDLAVMEDLVKDFASALDDHGPAGGLVKNKTVVADVRRRRRFRKRRPAELTGLVNNSDTDSSQAEPNAIQDATNHHMHKIWPSSAAKQSDSDDGIGVFNLGTRSRYSLSRYPAISAPVLAESDSVTDCFSPVRPPRRRRHLKKMAIGESSDSHNQHQHGSSSSQQVQSKQQQEVAQSSSSSAKIRQQNRDVPACSRGMMCRKRKRSVREFGASVVYERCDGERHFNRTCSSCSSSSAEDDNSVDDGREGDDEHSDICSESDSTIHQHLPPPPPHLPTANSITDAAAAAMETTIDDVMSHADVVNSVSIQPPMLLSSFPPAVDACKSINRLYIPGKRRLMVTTIPNSTNNIALINQSQRVLPPPTSSSSLNSPTHHNHHHHHHNHHHHHHHCHASPPVLNGGKSNSPMSSPPLSVRTTNNHKRCKMLEVLGGEADMDTVPHSSSDLSSLVDINRSKVHLGKSCKKIN